MPPLSHACAHPHLLSPWRPTLLHSGFLQVSAAVVTCGGLCPGLNDVIQNIVHTLVDYGVPQDNILGIK